MSRPLSCPVCGSLSPSPAKFCAECGTRLLPALSPTETRKLVTIVFCDLVGSTELGERLDPEAFRHVQIRYFAACESALLRHGGSVEKFIGDAVLCVFGTPTVREDDALRACRAALDLVAAVDAVNVELEEAWGVRLAVRTGVNTGLVAAGDPSRGQVLVTGDAVNTAARLEQAAGAGEILIGATTRELLGEDGVCAPLPSLELKGKGKPVPAWRLIAVDGPTHAMTVRASRRPLVGRADELRRVEAWLNGTGPGAAGGMCLILGAPGIGKSRLLAEVVERTPRPALWGRCPPYGEGITYWPLADWLDALGDDTVQRAAGADNAERLRFAVERSEKPATLAEIGEAAGCLVADLARERQLVLVAEDVNWAESSMLELLTSLARVSGVAVIATARPDPMDVAPDLANEPGDLRLPLLPLDRDAAAELLQDVAPDTTETERRRLLGLAEGSPLMIGQLALHVAEGGDPAKLPAGLEAVLQARVESLSAEERTVAERGAVMGREFWDSGVAALAQEASSPAAAIALLTGRDFIVEGRADGAPDVTSPTLSRVFSTVARPYSFTHALLRDSVYQATPKLRRADLHERLASLLEEGKATDELVAFHLERAARLRADLRPQESEQLAARAAEHLERAGERALARRDSEAARALLTRAAALLDGGSSARERIELSLAAAGRTAGVELVPGDIMGGYRVRAVAGRGGMGVVYRADDLALGRQVALKVIAPQLAGDVMYRERFARETRVAAGLEHPNVVPVYSAGEENGQLFIAMRFVDGTDLQALLREGALAPERAVGIVAQVAAALDAAHVRGLVHRDVKPANILVTKVGRAEQAYLTDFGLTRDAAAGDGLTKTGQWIGTLAYVAPEQIRGESVDARADVYALGAVLYQCLTGQAPFHVQSELEAIAAHLDEPPPKPSRHGAPRALDAVVERAMSKDPVRRFRSAGDVARAAVAAVEGRRGRLTERSVATGAAAAVDTGRRRHRRSGRGALMMGVAAGAVVVALAVAAAFVAGAFDSGSNTPRNPAGQVVGAPVSLPYDPDRVAVGNGRVWALSDHDGGLMRFDIRDGRVATYPAGVDLGGGSHPDVAVGVHAVWVAHAAPDVGGIDHVDPATGQAVQHVTFPLASAVAVGDGAVWAVAPSASKAPGSLVRIDPVRDRIVGDPIKMGRDPAAVVVGEGSVWVANRGDDSVWRIDPRRRAVTAKVAVGDQPAAVAVGGGRVWVANIGDRSLMRIDPATNRVEGAPISLGKDIQDLAASDDAVWVSAADGTVTRLDPQTGQQVGSPLTPARSPLALAVENGVVWVGSAADRTLAQIREGTG